MVDTAASSKGSLLIGIPKDSLAPKSRSVPPSVTYYDWTAPDGRLVSGLRVSHVQVRNNGR